jgi:hypothetical protein
MLLWWFFNVNSDLGDVRTAERIVAHESGAIGDCYAKWTAQGCKISSRVQHSRKAKRIRKNCN